MKLKKNLSPYMSASWCGNWRFIKLNDGVNKLTRRKRFPEINHLRYGPASSLNHAKYFLNIQCMTTSISWARFMTINLRFKRYIQRCDLPRANTHHDITIFEVDGMVWSMKKGISLERTWLFQVGGMVYSTKNWMS